jgi:hypothetical protein
MSYNKPYFIQFGCWNNGICGENNDNDLSKVMRLLKLKEPEFIVISGDNYYPPKTEEVNGDKKIKKKFFIENDFISGFNCLPKNIPIYVNYGNHDYETGLIMEDGIKENSCELIKREKSYFTNAENSLMHLDMFREIDFADSTKIIMIDTTIYDDDDFQDNIYKCYKEINNGFTDDNDDINVKIKNIQVKVKQVQSTFITNTINELNSNPNIKNIIVVGHHPLMGFKIKDKKGKRYVDFLCSKYLIEFIYKEICSKIRIPGIKFYYLCADLHQYQCGNINITSANSSETSENGGITIRQYIVGTGGASKDEYDKDFIQQNMPNTTQVINDTTTAIYQMTDNDFNNSTSENGFLICEKGDANNLSFKFETIDGRVIVGGKKTRKNRNKRKTRKGKTRKRKSNKRNARKRT